MTREEAIKRFQRMKKILSIPNSDAERTIEAIDMAIESLSANYTTKKPNDVVEQKNDVVAEQTDLISRADAINAVCNAQCELDVPHYPRCDQVKYCDEIKALLTLPSAEAKPSPKDMLDGMVLIPQHDWIEMQKKLEEYVSADAPNGDLISRQWLLEVYGDYIGDNGEPKYHVPLEVVRQNIKDAPSTEAVQVVRCKDCKHWQKIDYTNSGICHERPNVITSQKADDFCSYGERREP